MSDTKKSSPEQFPSELTEKVRNLHEKLQNLEKLLEPLLSSTALEAKESLDSADKARYDLSLCYGLSSLLWAYMLVQGEDPKDTALKHELNRVRDYMTRVQQLEDRVKRPRFAPGTASRFVRNALYDPEKKKDDTGSGATSSR
ncbi:nuclear nucleic acid-binding protein C1D [Galendromus occidentalis]|uniref:Nuclear nucleic acid-binding protein C1D n=1 Tax=Galendromus occidentalis TaxID=34638 RepID=A0AAJ6QVY7_9ACAR|nr:nuclear nucleic acid-binding protein C1D [Galendromus occidentalis]